MFGGGHESQRVGSSSRGGGLQRGRVEQSGLVLLRLDHRGGRPSRWCAITALFSWYFYKRAGDELREEAANLRHYVNAVLSMWEREGYEVPRDPETGTPYARVRKDLVLKWRTDADAGSAGEDSPPRSGTPDPQEDARRPW